MTSTKTVHEQAEAYIYETILQSEADFNKYADRLASDFDPRKAMASRIADTLHDAKLLRSPNDTEKIAIAVAEAMVSAGFKSGE